MKKFMRPILAVFALGIVVATIGTTTTYASNSTSVTQVINSGTLATDIRDASRVSVASPVVAMTATPFSFNCQTATGSLGTNTQRIYIDNPSAANNGWTLTIAATSGATALWNNTGSTQSFDFNDPTTAGCADGADADTKAGQMTLNASAGTLTADCSTCSLTSITKGSSAAFSQGTLDSLTLLTAAAASDDVGRWYLTGVTVNQTVPAEQSADSYSFGLTATVTAS